MGSSRTGQIAVIFVSRRTNADDIGYAEAAEAMERLASVQPGYAGFVSARGGDGLGITVSYWADEASALAWRNHPEHTYIRDRGRAFWYTEYEVIVTQATRSYGWARP